MAMDELDLVFLAPADSPLWQPLGNDERLRVDGEPRRTLAPAGDLGWSDVARKLEQDLVWAEVVALLEGER